MATAAVLHPVDAPKPSPDAMVIDEVSKSAYDKTAAAQPEDQN